MIKTISQISAGAAGFIATAGLSAHAATEALSQAKPLDNADTYVKGLLVSGLIQIALKIIDKWSERRKTRKAANAN